MVTKRVLCPARLRRVPPQFSWIDQRLVQDRYISRCSPPALALYLFLLTVADADGLSYYSDASIGRLLSIDPASIALCRRELLAAGLIAYERPLYQVLALDPETIATSSRRSQAAQPLPLGKLLAGILEKPR